MRAGFGQFNVPTDEYLQYAAQFGATDVLLNTPQLLLCAHCLAVLPPRHAN